MKTRFVLGIGGTNNPASSTEAALRLTLAAIEKQGIATQLFGGAQLRDLPYYAYGATEHSPVARDFLAAIRAADGFVIASPGFHGTISGLVKNGLDYIEDTARDSRPYLDGAPVGLIVTAAGWQATGSTLLALRSVVHALRGWPTPFGACIKTRPGMFAGGTPDDPMVSQQLEIVGRQVVDFLAVPRTRIEIN